MIPQAYELVIESLDQEGRGVAHADGKVIFVEGALAGERVLAEAIRRKPSYEIAKLTSVVRESAMRVSPRCPHFGVCGGCSMQHLDAAAQVAVKQRVLEDNFRHLAKLRPETVFRPIHGPTWGYRYRARLSVRNVPKKGGVLVGFHERKSSYVADMRECHVLPAHVSDLLVPLRNLIGLLSVRDRLPQIEVAIGEGVTVLVLRILDALTADDEQALRDFADRHGVQFWLQTKGPETVLPFYPVADGVTGAAAGAAAAMLEYGLPEFAVRMPFKPTDFTQVNPHINRVLVGRALRLLDAQPHERIVDLFCGLGNFTLPIARAAREVVGIEGSATLTRRAEDNARANGLSERTRFATANLFEANLAQFEALGHFDKALIDPPREGALEVCRVYIELGERAPRRIVYVSCNPSTLARDAAVLVHEAGYVLRGAGVVNMFPHTSHVESIAVFEKP